VRGRRISTTAPLTSGHFMAEESPAEVVTALRALLAR
jgi:hypothetical protein